DVEGYGRPEEIRVDKVVRHDIGQAEVVVRMKMSEEDRLDLLGFDARLDHSAHGSDPAVDQIFATVHDEQRGGLGPVGPQRRPARRAEKDDLGNAFRDCGGSALGSFSARPANYRRKCKYHNDSKRGNQCRNTHGRILRYPLVTDPASSSRHNVTRCQLRYETIAQVAYARFLKKSRIAHKVLS